MHYGRYLDVIAKEEQCVMNVIPTEAMLDTKSMNSLSCSLILAMRCLGSQRSKTDCYFSHCLGGFLYGETLTST